MNWRALIVDDEPMARKRLKRFLASAPGWVLAGECADGHAAMEAIQTLKPDLVFLDVQMPEISGFQVLQAIDPPLRPIVIFVTAFDEFALRAFESQALDYLLKPFGEDRFQTALQRAETHLRGRGSPGFQQKLDGLLLVKCDGRLFFLKPAEIDWVEALGDYMKIHLGVESHLLRETMAEMEKRLAPHGFARIHRSRLVNIDRVREVRPLRAGESVVVLRNGTRLAGSKNHLKALQEKFGNRL